MIEALDIQVKGIVQGVGFRPFVYRLAKKYQLNGWVLNAVEGVFIHAEGEATRTLLQQQENQRLRDELAQSRAANNDYMQSQYILGQLGRYYQNPPCNPCGCGG